MNNICRILSDYQQSTYDRLIEISYVKNYLNSFVYFEEFQKFKEDENYRLVNYLFFNLNSNYYFEFLVIHSN